MTPPRQLAETDDRTAFDCGRPSMNGWFWRHAWHNHVSGASRVSVIADLETHRIAGYVTLSATQIERAFFPKPQQRNQPDPIPATLLGQLAVDLSFQGKGHAAALLAYGLRTALRVSESVGSAAVVTHPLDEGVRGFYGKWGFYDLPFDPKLAMIVRIVDLRKSFGEKL